MTWRFAIVCLWLTFFVHLIQGIFIGLCSSFYVSATTGSCCCTVYSHVRAGRPFCSAWIMWRYGVSMIVRILASARSRLSMFIWESNASGNGEYFWQAEGIWSTSYNNIDSIMRSQQQRTEAFACYRACTPDLFASGLLIFLSTGGSESEWGAIRAVLHSEFLDREGATYKERLAQLPEKLKSSWPKVSLEALKEDKKQIRSMVCTSVVFMMFGVWIEKEEAAQLEGWRSMANTFVQPRFGQRMLFNTGIKKVKALRKNTVNILERHNLQERFVGMNARLPSQYRREPIVKLCDEVMYAVGFAGIGGTSACVESVTAFLHRHSGEVPEKYIDFSKFADKASMIAAYKANPVAYIQETCRLDPPVTSATTMIPEDTEVTIGGKSLMMYKGMLQQYALSLANRDPAVFENPKLFDPNRSSLNKAVTWNGRLDQAEMYPRICPGRYLSIQVAQSIIDVALSAETSGP